MTLDSSVSWSLLASEGGVSRGEFRVVESGVVASEGQALLAIDSRGLRHLLIPIRGGARIEPDEKSSGVTLRSRELVGDGNSTASFVDLSCNKPHLSEVFRSLVDEILETLPTDPARPATVVRTVLNRWRELLNRERPGILSGEELIGLFGELWVLRTLAQHNPSAISTWVGPRRARFDFQRGSTCLEVKTSLAGNRRLVTVHGLEQLQPETGFTLYLAVVSVTLVKDAGDSIPDVIAELKRLEVDPLELADKLSVTGYSEHDNAYYADQEFVVRSVHLFEVDSNFPRIVPSSFVGGSPPANIESLRYNIDLTSPPPSALAEEKSQGVLALLAGA